MDQNNHWISLNDVSTSIEAKECVRLIEDKLYKIKNGPYFPNITARWIKNHEKIRDAFNKRIIELTKKENTIVAQE